ncbi:hypothetical protein M2150_002115 [Lachnospiraceae bacterium PM6-15]|uniref:Type II secretion system protein n=1 Tax=Ohessyouella blattaphilus TaxID=2949333 RepID=A0ABT1EH19_9FIRM|nr:hypothetical protein [Ohessyouella blattaphilus]MCP1110002.1 hypothetical protein [Ohessyouella blattaphilus]MCR8563396.1 hypothetical protein [Ohessyouella blattaphilus]MDL2249138.1 hypothetical protein [Lachnospiraceae bacterium OttesenSCG-928-J05]
MNKQLRGRSGTFLMEFIIAICFFTVACAICLQVFVKSHLISNESKAYDFAVSETTSLAEELRLGKKIASPLYYNDLLEPCEKGQHTYEILVEEGTSEDLPTYRLSVYHDDQKEPLYELEVAHYQKARGGLKR